MDAAKPRPPPNLEAQSSQDIYPLSVLIGDDVLRQVHVQKWQDADRDRQNVQTSSLFVSNRINKVVKTKDTTKIKTLRYLLALIQFKQSLKKSPKNPYRVPNKTEEQQHPVDAEPGVYEAINKKFAPGG